MRVRHRMTSMCETSLKEKRSYSNFSTEIMENKKRGVSGQASLSAPRGLHSVRCGCSHNAYLQKYTREQNYASFTRIAGIYLTNPFAVQFVQSCVFFLFCIYCLLIFKSMGQRRAPNDRNSLQCVYVAPKCNKITSLHRISDLNLSTKGFVQKVGRKLFIFSLFDMRFFYYSSTVCQASLKKF